MGFKATEWAFGLELGSALKAVLVALAHRADDKTNECYPGQVTLCAMTGLSPSTVRRSLAEVERLGLITRSARFAGRYRTSDSYRLLVGVPVSLPVTVTTGQDDHRSQEVSLPVTVTLTTGHHDGARDQEVDQSDDQSRSNDYSTEFEDFWIPYPRKQGKTDALKAYKAARKTTDAQTILNGVQAYALLNIRTDKAFLKLPAGYLRGRRWEDEQIVNSPPKPDQRTYATTNVAANIITPTDMCPRHPGYPVSEREQCAACARDELEGRDF